MSDEEKKIADIKSIFPDENVAARVVETVVHERPIGWDRKSNAPYYKEKFARSMKKDIDKMIREKCRLVYRYSVFCANGQSKRTLYNRINQSIRYLLEKMDPERIYFRWYESVDIRQKSGLGVTISFFPGLGMDGTGVSEEPGEAIISNTMPAWRLEMEEWIESGEGQYWVREGLVLNPAEVQELKDQFTQTKGIMVSIKPTSIKLVRVNE